MLIDRLREELRELRVEHITEAHLPQVLALLQSNAHYFSLTQKHSPSLEECRADMTALPPGRGMEHKRFLALYRENTCVAVVDFVTGYPTPETGYLGLLIVDGTVRGKGLGRAVLEGVFRAAKGEGLTKIALACHVVNRPGLAFWRAHGFCEVNGTYRVTDGERHRLLRMERAV